MTSSDFVPTSSGRSHFDFVSSSPSKRDEDEVDHLDDDLVLTGRTKWKGRR